MTNVAERPTTTLLNKILIPVITTVLGATAIYFLGFNKKGGRSDMEKLLITKEATVKGWKSFVTSQNIGFKNSKSILNEYEPKIAEAANQTPQALITVLKDFETEMMRESKKASSDIAEILKDEDLDKNFASMLNRSLDNGTDQEKKVVTFFDKLVVMLKSDLTPEEKGKKWQEEAAKFQAMSDGIEERSATEAEDISKILSEKYGQPFDLNELLVYKEYKDGKDKPDNNKDKDPTDPAPKDPNSGTEFVEDNNTPADDKTDNNETAVTAAFLTGEWDMPGGSLELNKDGTMYWSFGNKGYTSGKWKLVEGKLQMRATNPDTNKTSLLVGFLTDVTTHSFTMTYMTTPKEIYKFKRKK